MSFISFQRKMEETGITDRRGTTDILQINIGKLCNQACHHCHVEAGPKRKENMERATADRILELLQNSPSIKTVDITGGAPEMNPHFRTLVMGARKLNKEVIDRCNLTVFYEPGQEETPYFLKEYQVHLVASLPCYSKDNVEKQRGQGVFNKSIEALKLLNRLGYGPASRQHQLDLVYNPTGPFLPPDQKKLEQSYKKELKELFGIQFNRLFTITNMPIKRFLNDLERNGQWEHYMNLLANHFNPHAAQSIMCRNLVSVAWNGELFDCDFNQMLELPLGKGRTDLWQISSFNELDGKPITFANHCYACTAGAGSSCTGALDK